MGRSVVRLITVLLILTTSAGLAVARDLDDLLAEAEELYRETRYYEALDVAVEACDWYPESAAAKSFLGQVLLKMARFEEAREAYEDALDLDTYDFWAHYGLGLYHLTDGAPEHAIPEFQTARELWPEHELPYLMLARAHEALDLYADALVWMEEGIAALEAYAGDVPPSLDMERERIAFLANLIGRSPYRVSAGFDRTVVPMEDGRPVVRVHFGAGAGAEGRFLLDTASARPLMAHPEVVYRAAGERIAEIDDPGSGGRWGSYLILLDVVEIGGLVVHDVPCLVTERLMLGGADGVIGLPFLRRFAWTFDFEKAEITIRDPGAGLTPPHRYATERVESWVYPGGPLMVPTLLDENRPAVLILDTASSSLALDHEFFEREIEALIPVDRRADVGFHDSPHGAQPLLGFSLPSLSIGEIVVLEDVTVRTYSLEGSRRWAGVAAPGVIGLSVFDQWMIDLDFREGLLILWQR